MGYGDELMAAGEAEKLYNELGLKVVITDQRGRRRWSDIWDGNPAIATEADIARGKVQYITNGPNARPYNANVPFTAQAGIKFTDWRARDHRGRIYLTDEERELGTSTRDRVGPYWVIEPSPIASSNPNKQWFHERFADVVRQVSDRAWVQGVHSSFRPIEGITYVPTKTFRLACGLLSAASGYLGTEGGLHHAAAALGIPAVVIFGGCMSVETFGYPEHLNIADDGPDSPCGRWVPCEHCRQAMEAITVDRVVSALTSV